jgi:hypothetical protein
MADPKVRKQAGRKRKRRQLSELLPRESQRTKTVGVRLSETELASLAAQAKSQHLKKATILRNSWLGKEPRTLPLPEVLGPAAGPARVMSVTELADYRELVVAATKLNELTELLQPDGQLLVEAGALFGKLRQLLTQLVPPRTEK